MADAGRPHNSVMESLPGGGGHVMGCGEKAFGDCTRPTMGCLEEEPKMGKGKDRGGLRRDKYEKTEG